MSDEEIAKQAIGELATLATAIRKHRDQRGDDRCWMDDVELYQTLPEGYTAPARDSAVELNLCEKFIACRHNPSTEYVSPQRRIEELQTAVAATIDAIDNVLNGADEHGRSKLAAAAELLGQALSK